MSTFIIAEIGQAHEGSLGIAHSYIDALADTGVDAVKFQTHIAKAESSEHEPFRINFSYEDKTRIGYWERMQFTEEQWLGLKKHCEEKGMEFISSPFSIAAVELLENINVKRYKIGSGEISNHLLLEKIARTGKPVILSSGLSSFEELDETIDFLRPYQNKISLLQCTTSYPTKPGQWGLNLIPTLKKRYKIPVGFSDHSGKIYPSLAAFLLGAQVLEFHVVFDRRMFGPDASSSLTIDEVKELVNAVKMLEFDFERESQKTIDENINDLKKIFEKSLAVNKNLSAGHTIQFDDLEAKKPKGFGIAANNYKDVIGKKLAVNKEAFSFIKLSDLE